MRRVILLVLSGLIGGCVNQLAARQAYLGQFIGQPEPVLIQQMGVPARTYETGGTKYLAYDESRTDILPSAPSWGYGAPYLGWYGGAFPPQVVTLTCETTFAVSDGVVRSFNLRGNACG